MMMIRAVRSLFPVALLLSTAVGAQNSPESDVPTRHNEATVAQLQAEMASGELTSEELTQEYIARINGLGLAWSRVNSVIELNPDATADGAPRRCLVAAVPTCQNFFRRSRQLRRRRPCPTCASAPVLESLQTVRSEQ